MSFQPSTYSGLNQARPNQGSAGGLSELIGAAQSITETSIMAVSQRRGLKSSQSHERKLARQEEKLIALRTQQTLAEGVAQNAKTAIARLGTTKTLFVVGGVVMTIGMIVAAFVAVKRGGQYEDEYE